MPHTTEAQLLRTASNWLREGRRVVLVTVVRTWGSSPRPPGSMMLIRDDGQVVGSVSGGCIEDDLIARVQRGDLNLSLPHAVLYGKDAEEVHRFGLPCGGTVQLVLEPLGVRSQLPNWLTALTQRRSVSRCLQMDSGEVALIDVTEGTASATRDLSYDGHTLVTLHGPCLRLIIIGGGQLSHHLARMAMMLDYEVTVCEPRIEYHESWDGTFGVQLSHEMPDDLVIAMQPDTHTAVVALTHDPKLVDLALMEALRSTAFYVGALGSRRNNEARKIRLLGFDLTPAQTHQLHGPVGLNLGARTPAEIALAILAEMTAVRKGRADGRSLLSWESSQSVCEHVVTAS